MLPPDSSVASCPRVSQGKQIHSHLHKAAEGSGYCDMLWRRCCDASGAKPPPVGLRDSYPSSPCELNPSLSASPLPPFLSSILLTSFTLSFLPHFPSPTFSLRPLSRVPVLAFTLPFPLCSHRSLSSVFVLLFISFCHVTSLPYIPLFTPTFLHPLSRRPRLPANTTRRRGRARYVLSCINLSSVSLSSSDVLRMYLITGYVCELVLTFI